jgi:hypothetical protein
MIWRTPAEYRRKAHGCQHSGDFKDQTFFHYFDPQLLQSPRQYGSLPLLTFQLSLNRLFPCTQFPESHGRSGLEGVAHSFQLRALKWAASGRAVGIESRVDRVKQGRHLHPERSWIIVRDDCVCAEYVRRKRNATQQCIEPQRAKLPAGSHGSLPLPDETTSNGQSIYERRLRVNRMKLSRRTLARSGQSDCQPDVSAETPFNAGWFRGDFDRFRVERDLQATIGQT